MKGALSFFKLVLLLYRERVNVIGSGPSAKQFEYNDAGSIHVCINGAITFCPQAEALLITDTLFRRDYKNNNTSLESFEGTKPSEIYIIKSSARSNESLINHCKSLFKRSDIKIYIFGRFFRSIVFFLFTGARGLGSGAKKPSNGMFMVLIASFFASEVDVWGINPFSSGHAFGGLDSARSHSEMDHLLMTRLTSKAKIRFH